MVTLHEFRLDSGERTTVEADPREVELIVAGECHLVLSWADVGRLVEALLAGQAAVKEVS